MKLLVDGRSAQNSGGVGAVSRQLFAAIQRIAPYRGCQVEFAIADNRTRIPSTGRTHELPARGFLQVGIPKLAHRTGCDFLFIPRQTLPVVAPPSVRRIALIYDIGFKRLPSLYPKSTGILLTTRVACKLADLLFTDSEFTSRELADVGWSAGARALPFQALRVYKPLPNPNQPFALVVGTEQPHKNVPAIIRAWSRRPRGRWTLRLCGAPAAGSEAIDNAMQRAGDPSITRLGYVSADELNQLESEASLYINGSLYEGLSIPTLDALASGTPTISSRAGHPGDVLAGAPSILFNASDEDEIDDRISAAVGSAQLRDEMAEVGRDRVQLTDWPTLAGHFFDALVRDR